MQLTERIQIRKGTSEYAELDRMCFLSKNLYNAALYAVRQHFFQTGKYKSNFTIGHEFIATKNPDYYAMNTKVSQQVLKLVDKNFKSFFSLVKKGIKVRIPKYLAKNGRQILMFTMQTISKTALKQGYIKLAGMESKFKIRDDIQNVACVRVVPRPTFDCYDVEVVYNVPDTEMKQDNGRYAAIDLGISNLATVSFNCEKPFIVNGRPLKSINQYYNKRRSECKNLKSNKSRSLNRKRDNKVRDYLHKASRMVVNQLVSRDVNTLVIGKNDGWKQEANMGRRCNQTFVSIPFEEFIGMMEYKCRMAGITVVKANESHTSKCSFLDMEPIGHHEEYVGKRIRRGLFRSADGRLINADLNGSLNIMRKEVGERAFPLKNGTPHYSIEVCSTPAVFTPSK